MLDTTDLDILNNEILDQINGRECFDLSVDDLPGETDPVFIYQNFEDDKLVFYLKPLCKKKHKISQEQYDEIKKMKTGKNRCFKGVKYQHIKFKGIYDEFFDKYYNKKLDTLS